MKYETIEDIYTGNDKVRERLKAVVSQLTSEKISALPDGEKWTIAQIVEHIAMVDESTIRICSKLLKKSEDAGHKSNGGVVMSDGFLQKGVEIAAIKIEAPSFVQPSGQRTISESLEKLDENHERLTAIRPLFESVGGTEFKFPHPFFGEISAQEWLALKGGHELRHLKQIERIMEKIG